MPSASGSTTPTTNAGIITDAETGQRHIPASTRADGSKRKEIKIRPGYRPPEDVEVYKNRTAQAFKTRGQGGVPGAEGLKDDADKKTSAALNKNAKRREARKRAKAEGAEADVGEKEPEVDQATSSAEEIKEEPVVSKEEEEKIEKEKKARKLKKKLREAKELQEKKEKGEKLLHEQFEKVIKINELIRDLDKLGFDANGDPKEEVLPEP